MDEHTVVIVLRDEPSGRDAVTVRTVVVTDPVTLIAMSTCSSDIANNKHEKREKQRESEIRVLRTPMQHYCQPHHMSIFRYLIFLLESLLCGVRFRTSPHSTHRHIMKVHAEV
jgi:hypothetical protein